MGLAASLHSLLMSFVALTATLDHRHLEITWDPGPRTISLNCSLSSVFGVAAFSDCLRQEMYRWGVRVILIEPSNFVAATGILTAEGIDRQAEALWSGASDTVRQDYGRDYFTGHVARMKSFVNSGLKDMSLVLDDITDALTSPCPNNRYSPMEIYWWVRLQVMTHLPTAIADWLYVAGATL
ncbi:D-beta-hydroxybutyrate dehydrogenase, mitochondrial-like [Athene cunicularia]|uniref:D-beta-hydroxybutyrate dehydrogenase, mitochondrial-like n=1 Tax=Athene cunicularia TaxID=194338 RepID=UPI000EF7082D|nr:D-beta-hydroxybutyrate dehydrogenase, mitochondrial-like [Athene cunicularia]